MGDFPPLLSGTKEDWMLKGIEAFKSGDKDKAVEYFIKHIDQNADHRLQIEVWLGLAESVNSIEEIAGCLNQILRLNPQHSYARQKLNNLRSESSRPEKQILIDNLRERIRLEPQNPTLYYDLALSLLSKEPNFASIMNDDPIFWKESLKNAGPIWLIDSPDLLHEVKRLLDISLGLGLLNGLNEAKSNFILAKIATSQAVGLNLNMSEEKLKQWNKSLVNFSEAIIAGTKKHLKRYPHNIVALRLRKAAYEFLGKEKLAEQTDFEIQRVKNLQANLQAILPSSNANDILIKTKSSFGPRNDGVLLEEQVYKLLVAMGMQATTTKVTGDGGLDIVAYSETPIFSGKYIVQCKDWAGSVGEPVLRDLFGLVISEGANKGIIITTGQFTSAAEKFADGKPLELIDGNKLKLLFQQYKIF